MASDPTSAFVNDYVAAIHDQNAAVFAGAGLSIPAGLVNWKELLREIAAEVGLDVDQENDLVAVAQYHLNERGSRHRINQALVSEFADRAELTENHSILASLPIRTYWTTNYDALLEQALKAAGKMPDVKSTPENLTTTALQGDLVSKTFLFLGFSFSDPNLDHVMSPPPDFSSSRSPARSSRVTRSEAPIERIVSSSGRTRSVVRSKSATRTQTMSSSPPFASAPHTPLVQP